MASSLPAFSKLHHTNYTIWAGDMEAWLRSQGLWRLVSGSAQPPIPPIHPTTAFTTSGTEPSTSAVSTIPAEGFSDAQNTYEAKLEAWKKKEEQAATLISLMLEQNQQIHVSSLRCNPYAMWQALEAVHTQKTHRAEK